VKQALGPITGFARAEAGAALLRQSQLPDGELRVAIAPKGQASFTLAHWTNPGLGLYLSGALGLALVKKVEGLAWTPSANVGVGAVLGL
jgi:hypothetical protein